MASSTEPLCKKRKSNPEVRSELKDDLDPIPVLSYRGVVLNEDVTAKIFDYLDPASFCTATTLSKPHHASLIPRQKHVWIGGFSSFQAFKRRGFRGIEFFSGRDSALVTNTVLAKVAVGFPNLHGVDLSGCVNIRAWGICHFAIAMGPRLRSFTMSHSNVSSANPGSQIGTDGVDEFALRSLVQSCPNLLKLDVKVSPMSFLGLHDLGSVQELCFLVYDSLDVPLLQGRIERPPQLRVLKIETTHGESRFDWRILLNISAPHLKTLEIRDSNHYVNPGLVYVGALSANDLIAIMEQSTDFETLIIHSMGTDSLLYLGIHDQQEGRLFSFLQSNGIRYIGPKRVTKRSGADFMFTANGEFVNNSGWIGRDE